jgi:hypothetical protein
MNKENLSRMEETAKTPDGEALVQRIIQTGDADSLEEFRVMCGEWATHKPFRDFAELWWMYLRQD